MVYTYRDRLKRNSTRFQTINTENVSYSHIGALGPIVVAASLILRRPMLGTTPPAEVQFDRQWFVFNVPDLTIGTVLFLPSQGDRIKRANQEEFEIVPENDDMPLYQYVTSDRERIIVHTQVIG